MLKLAERLAAGHDLRPIMDGMPVELRPALQEALAIGLRMVVLNQRDYFDGGPKRDVAVDRLTAARLIAETSDHYNPHLTKA